MYKLVPPKQWLLWWGSVAFEEKYGSQLELIFRFIDRALAIGVLA